MPDVEKVIKLKEKIQEYKKWMEDVRKLNS